MSLLLLFECCDKFCCCVILISFSKFFSISSILSILSILRYWVYYYCCYIPRFHNLVKNLKIQVVKKGRWYFQVHFRKTLLTLIILICWMLCQKLYMPWGSFHHIRNIPWCDVFSNFFSNLFWDVIVDLAAKYFEFIVVYLVACENFVWYLVIYSFVWYPIVDVVRCCYGVFPEFMVNLSVGK